MAATRWRAVTHWDGEGNHTREFRNTAGVIRETQDPGMKNFTLSGYTRSLKGEDQSLPYLTDSDLRRMIKGESITALHKPSGCDRHNSIAEITVRVEATAWD